jgi:FixJ family two-component response regulator
MTNKQIAAKLGVSPQAIDARRAKAMGKLHVDSIAELTRMVTVL